ncbi:hypothetical protein HU200_034354 [Digitaria exilis]|uniref:DUF1618 domain-containing protein n=1 Tax=Digitaria exilis TaxID=1010633 RepID=A0A835BJL1_9POAL|nr:hypothetical protein HU200_034354 [Digitaria exilis]
MSKRKSSSSDDERRGHHAAKRRPKLAKKKKHLYLLVDDWERGYSVRKLDVDAFDYCDAAETDDLLPLEQHQYFTDPPVARIEALHEVSCHLTSHGTKIFAMQPGEGKPAIPGFDTHTHGVTICPWPSCQGNNYSNPLFVSVAGDKLFLFMDVLAEVLGDQPPYDSKAPWSWTTIKQARPPFFTGKVLCHAMHPDGRTLFVSAGSRRRRRPNRREEHYYSESESEPEPESESSEQGQGTFSFDTERLQWTKHGDWVLPFSGQAYFDAELDAWIGLCGERNCAGFLCSCDVVAAADEFITGASPPSWKLGQEKLFMNRQQLHLGVKLLYMGDSSFCLVESLIHKEDDHLFRDESILHVDSQFPLPRRRVLCINTFGLKYNKKGELQTKPRRAGACITYKRPHDFGESLSLTPSAFWL